MGLRVCLVTPFAWSQPHDVNDHVAGVAAGLRALGHDVDIVAPSNRPSPDVTVIGPAVPISRRSAMGVPVGIRTALSVELARGNYDVVHGFEPGLPSVSYLALRYTNALAVGTFFSPERIAYPPRRAQRLRLLARIDALLATSDEVAAVAADRFPGDYRIVSVGVDTTRFAPARKRKVIAVEWRPAERLVARAVLRVLQQLPGWEVVLVRTKPLTARPYVPRKLVGRVHVRTCRDAQARAAVLNEAAIFVPSPGGSRRLALEAAAAGAAIAAPAAVAEQPELAAAAVARLTENDELREREQVTARADAEAQTFENIAAELDALYRSLAARRRHGRDDGDPLAGRPWIVCDLHLHTEWSHDCSMPVAAVLDHAEAIGLGAIAITDHNRFGGALEAVELARDRDLIVIPAEEVKTDGQGEVIGLFLREEIPRGLSFAETVAAIRAQGGVVYIPHPFDRMHAIPDVALLQKHLAEIDVFEVYNARLLFEAYNDEALRFARKYNLTMGAGSDAHVLQGVGTGAVRMRAFDGPEEFLASLRTAEILRRPKSLVYLQGLKWVAQAKERVR
jgi:hypothetical protein